MSAQSADVVILAWMADLAQDGGIEQQSHEPAGSAAKRRRGERNLLELIDVPIGLVRDVFGGPALKHRLDARGLFGADDFARQFCWLGGHCTEMIPAVGEDLHLVWVSPLEE